MDIEIKESQVAYIASTSHTSVRPAVADEPGRLDQRSVARAALFQPHLAASDDEVKQFISADARILHGAPAIRGTRIAVYWIVGLIEQGYSVKRILKLYPQLTESQVRASLRFASIVLEDQSDRKE
jgi:uncharacterized protein (DUF433 family)